MEPVRCNADGLGARAGDLRFCASAFSVRLWAFEPNEDRVSSLFKTAKGVCRDFAHLAVAFCRCMNIPARYCTGYLGDMGVPPPYAPMDFAAWFEAFLGDGWCTFDPRNNTPRIGRILIARGRDAADVALTTASGRRRWKTSRCGRTRSRRDVLCGRPAERWDGVCVGFAHQCRRR